MKCGKCGSEEKFHESGFTTKRQPLNCPDCGRFMSVRKSADGMTFYCGRCQEEKHVEIKVSTYRCAECGHFQEDKT